MMPGKNADWVRTVYPQCLESLRSYLRKFVGAEAAKDLAHDAFVQVFTAPDFEQIREPQKYLFRTARNMALNAKKSHWVARQDAVADVADIADGEASVERQAMTAEEYELLCETISCLTERQKEALTLRVFYGFTCPEIAKRLGVSRATVHRDLAAALGALHDARTRQDGSSDGGDSDDQAILLEYEREVGQ